jgi:FKBP-type peptidyl-prolyl cis-trans isomerase
LPASCRSVGSFGAFRGGGWGDVLSTQPELDSDEAKALYALGRNVGRQLGDLDCFGEEELETVLSGLWDTLTHAPARVELSEHLPRAAEMFKLRAEAKASAASAAGQAALEAAAKETGAATTDTGLVIRTLSEGSGPAPAASDRVRVHYTGYLVDGAIFDTSQARGEPLEFALGQVVAGWREGLQLMKEGGRAKLTLPSRLAYGEQGHSLIPPNSVLTFEVELLTVLPREDDAWDGGSTSAHLHLGSTRAGADADDE